MPADLASLRAAIDEIDGRIADLLVERLGVVREIGRVKGDLAAGRLALRLAREAQMMRRLLARTAGRFPALEVFELNLQARLVVLSACTEVPEILNTLRDLTNDVFYVRGIAPHIDGNVGIIHIDRHLDIQEKDMDERMHTTPWYWTTHEPSSHTHRDHSHMHDVGLPNCRPE